MTLTGLGTGINHDAKQDEVGDLSAECAVSENQIIITSKNSNPLDLLENAAKATFSASHHIKLIRDQVDQMFTISMIKTVA